MDKVIRYLGHHFPNLTFIPIRYDSEILILKNNTTIGRIEEHSYGLTVIDVHNKPVDAYYIYKDRLGFIEEFNWDWLKERNEKN